MIVVRYLKILIDPTAQKKPAVDADWNADILDHKSTPGWMVQYNYQMEEQETNYPSKVHGRSGVYGN